MDQDMSEAVPSGGMVISVVSRHDFVIVDPERFLQAARAAYLAENPGATEDEAARAVATAVDAAYALHDHYGTLHADLPGSAPSDRTARRRMLPADRITDRSDGLSPAGWLTVIRPGFHRPIQDHGCFQPSTRELFDIVEPTSSQ